MTAQAAAAAIGTREGSKVRSGVLIETRDLRKTYTNGRQMYLFYPGLT